MQREILYDTFFKVLIAVFITRNPISWDSELDSPWGLIRFCGKTKQDGKLLRISPAVNRMDVP